MRAVDNQTVQEALARVDANTFIDRTSGRMFRRYRYFDFIVIQDIENGFINAGSFVIETGRMQGKHRQFKDFKQTSDYQIAIEATRETMLNNERIETSRNSLGISDSEVEAYMLRILNEGYGDEVRGTYVPFRVFQLVALWADKRHKLEILKLLESINERANAEAISAYEEMKRLNEQLSNELETLKSRVKETEEQIELKKTLIQKLTTPVNVAASKQAIIASLDGTQSFQLRFRNQEVSPANEPNCLRYINLYQADKVLKIAKSTLQKAGIIQSSELKRKQVISREHLDRVFNIIERISRNEPIEISDAETREIFFINELERLRELNQTGQVRGKIFELEYIRAHSELTPYALIPRTILNTYNENKKEYGIDAVKIVNNEITDIYQIKHHANTYLRRDEIASFIAKCLEDRYAHVNKHLLIHNCIISEDMLRTLTEIDVNIEEV